MTVPGQGGLGNDMFSQFGDGIWRVELQAAIYVACQPVVEG